MLKKAVIAIGLLLLLSFTPLSLGQFKYSTFDGWQVESLHGYVSNTGDAIRLWTDTNDPYASVAIFKEYQPTDDFTFSVEVNSASIQACGLYIRGSLPQVGSFDGFNFEFGHYGQGLFLLARNFTEWMTSQVGYGEPHVWYTMKLSVHRYPFLIEASILDDNDVSIGYLSTSDIYQFGFDDIKYVGISVWGNFGDYSFRNIQDPTYSPQSSSISIYTDSVSAEAGSVVNIHGKLISNNSQPIENKTIVLSYTFPGIQAWIPISSCQTNPEGEYNIQWVNSASGTFTLKAEWQGNSDYAAAYNTTSLSFLPYQNLQTFIFESNSTLTQLSFNNQTYILSLNVTGPSNTIGFIRAQIAKSILSKGESLKVTLDGKQLNYTVTSTEQFWMYYFSYSHSTHQIRLDLSGNDSVIQPVSNMVILAAISLVLVLLLGVIVYLYSRKSNRIGHSKIPQ